MIKVLEQGLHLPTHSENGTQQHDGKDNGPPQSRHSQIKLLVLLLEEWEPHSWKGIA